MSALQGTVLRSESCDTGVNCLRVVCCGEIMEGKRHRIIGTAGHIDHGKTRLVKALTGTDTDRLSQEKERGITIENGFAPFLLPVLILFRLSSGSCFYMNPVLTGFL